VKSASATSAARGLSEERLRRLHAQGRAELFVPLAEWSRRRGRFDEATRLLEDGLEHWPGRVAAWVLLARVEAQQGRIDQARQHYRHVLDELDPRNLPALRALAVAALETGERERARDLLERWRREDPLDAELEDFLELIESHPPEPAGPGEGDVPGAETPPEAGRAEVLDLSLGELERDLLSAPSLRDEAAWDDPEGSASAERERRES